MSKPKANDTLQLGAKDVPWKCECGFLLSVLSPDKNTLRIKYKDLYLSIEGSDVKVTELCRRCATPNKIESNSGVPQVPQEHEEAFKQTASKPKQ